ncbi:LemA family protein [Candidatus Peregrinibacteria bacterium]|nr:LemA family protein [Candidatus Peregrinibacteria bacterium]
MKRSPLLIGLLVVGVLLIGWLWTGYNSLVTARGAVEGDWAQVETQYQRRFDLVPNLVSTVRGAANLEQDTLTQVTAARTQWQQADNRSEQIAAAEGFESALARLLVTVEAYPQLQATQAFRDLMTQLEGTENRIATARRDYNQTVQHFNVMVRRFPRNILAGLFGFDPEAFFDAAEGSETAPEVNFE